MDLHPIHAFVGHGASVTSVVALPDGRVASASQDTSVRVWSRTSWKQEGILKLGA